MVRRKMATWNLRCWAIWKLSFFYFNGGEKLERVFEENLWKEKVKKDRVLNGSEVVLKESSQMKK